MIDACEDHTSSKPLRHTAACICLCRAAPLHAETLDERHGWCAGGLEQRVEALAAAARMQAGAAGGTQLANGSLNESSLNKASTSLLIACPARIA